MYLTSSAQKMYLTNLKGTKAGIDYMLHDRSFFFWVCRTVIDKQILICKHNNLYFFVLHLKTWASNVELSKSRTKADAESPAFNVSFTHERTEQKIIIKYRKSCTQKKLCYKKTILQHMSKM